MSKVSYEIKEIKLDDIVIPKRLLRKSLDEEKMNELIASLKAIGLINPIVVMEKDGKYELISGLRRYLAARRLGWKTITAKIVSEETFKQLAITIHENVVREDINPLELAEYLKEVKEEYNLTLEQLAQMTGKSVGYISLLIKLLELPKPVQEYVRLGELDVRVAYSLRKLEDPELIVNTARGIVATRMSRDTAMAYIDTVLLKKKKEEAEEVIETIEETKKELQTVNQKPTVEVDESKKSYRVLFECSFCNTKYPVEELTRVYICDRCLNYLETLIQERLESQASQQQPEPSHHQQQQQSQA